MTEVTAFEQEAFEQQMHNVSLIAVLWRHYFVDDHGGDFVDCDEPFCAPFVGEVRESYAKKAARS